MARWPSPVRQQFEGDHQDDEHELRREDDESLPPGEGELAHGEEADGGDRRDADGRAGRQTDPDLVESECRGSEAGEGRESDRARAQSAQDDPAVLGQLGQATVDDHVTEEIGDVHGDDRCRHRDHEGADRGRGARVVVVSAQSDEDGEDRERHVDAFLECGRAMGTQLTVADVGMIGGHDRRSAGGA